MDQDRHSQNPPSQVAGLSGVPYLVLLYQLSVGEMHYGGEVVNIGALEPPPEEVADEHGAHVGFACSCRAVEGHHEGFHWIRVLQELPQALHHLLPHQGLPHQVRGQVKLQT